jgi:hypothetical protein
MHPEEIIKLARVDRLPKKEMDEQLSQFKKDNWEIMECVLFIRHNQFIGINECKDLLFNHKDWVAQEKAFRKDEDDKRKASFGG